MNEPRFVSRRWLKIVAVAVTLLVVALVARLWLTHERNDQLLGSYPDEIVKDTALVAYADKLARPAYAANCARCHGNDLEGNYHFGAPNLKDQDWLYDEGSVSQIEQLILYGIRSGSTRTRSLAVMPAYGQPVPAKSYAVPPLAPQQIRDVVQFLLQQGGKPHDKAGAVSGQKIYLNEGGCWDCHSEDAKGNPAIGAPDLVDDIWLYGTGTPDDIYQSVANGRSGICPAWFGRLPLLTIRALAVYIHERAQPAMTPSLGSVK